VSLEDIFWEAFRRYANKDGRTINGLAAQIDAARGDIGLASAIRIYVLERALDRDHLPE
jgi:predicted DNA-binding ribbon-helix-helix protein